MGKGGCDLNYMGLAAIGSISVAACGLHSDAVYLVVASVVFWALAILADAKAAEAKPVPATRVQTRYEQVELMTGIGWGSKREELRAHLLGVWAPKGPVFQSEDQGPEAAQSAGRGLGVKLGLAALAVAAVGSFFSWIVVAVALIVAAVVQYRETNRWDLVHALPINACLVIGSLALIYGPAMAVLSPAIFILGRSGHD